MQYLIKFTLTGQQLWRLMALEGSAALSHCSALVSAAFGYPSEDGRFELSCGGYEAAVCLDDLSLSEHSCGRYLSRQTSLLEHEFLVMKAEEHLYCLMPSCLVGSGSLAGLGTFSPADIAAWLDRDELPSLDLKEVNTRVRRVQSRAQGTQGAPIRFKPIMAAHT